MVPVSLWMNNRLKKLARTWTILGSCLPVTNWPLRSMTMRVLSLSQPDFNPRGVHSMEFILTGPRDFTGKQIKSLSSPTFRHRDGGWSFCFFVHHHQTKKNAVLVPTAAAVTYANLDLSAMTIFTLYFFIYQIHIT